MFFSRAWARCAGVYGSKRQATDGTSNNEESLTWAHAREENMHKTTTAVKKDAFRSILFFDHKKQKKKISDKKVCAGYCSPAVKKSDRNGEHI